MLPAEKKKKRGLGPDAGPIFFIIIAILLYPAACARDEDEDGDGVHDVALSATLVNKRLMSFAGIFRNQFKRNMEYCVKDIDKDWNDAFNFSPDLKFLANCVKETKGELTRRLCNSAEISFYFKSLSDDGETAVKTNYLKPSLNCNLSSWVSGCEPGWSCSIGKNHRVNLQDSKLIPARILNCRPCCEGFFCPRGLTCMIPCPLGAFCPLGKLNNTTGVCDPYQYHLPRDQPNHTCGGADLWAVVKKSGHMFCPAGYYCPSTIKKISCSSGHYCRKGSTSEMSCFTKSSCKPNSEVQNITLFGVLVMGEPHLEQELFISMDYLYHPRPYFYIKSLDLCDRFRASDEMIGESSILSSYICPLAALSLLLLVIYNFSGHVLSNRERRQAKSREAAARYAKETVQARERWKSAKDVAKKSAEGLQASFSRTFSRKKPEKPESASKAVKKQEASNLSKMIRSLEENPEKDEGFHMEIGDKNLKKNIPTAKQMHTRSQIFKYAYGQIEKEKAIQQEQENNNVTFSGVISMATDDERSRPPIEIAFKDLCLTLKGSKKKLLRSVTGKLMPGRIAALMGPSGAGKTTYLSAVAGKATGCDVTGLVLINGKADPILSYKKIIGFVPQDDIVHGNLTVEENLWFSARCRLSTDLSKADKVLVVERVIESLGLQAIRDSLVGTVEQRGISGGQRKRVNVGLEMVMEPSLLILDEPTSGLDSSSSQLLLRALRREALEGVNICMVVHQPSYALFKMFDDLILLAKGGFTVYHGAVKRVEEYFSGLGINVPDRVNPPDYFIDILEGIVKPNTSTGITYTQLPLQWMLHNGYDVPRDMLLDDSAAEASAKGSGTASTGAESYKQSVAGEVWDNVKDTVQTKKDDIWYHFKNSGDLSNRSTPGVLTQYKYFLGRVGKQRLREAMIQGVDYIILCLAGVCLGVLAKMDDDTFGLLGYTFTVIAVSLLSKIGALRSFGLEKLQYWRERASGMSSLAYFLARDTMDHFNTIIKPIVFLSMFYFFNNPRSSILDNYIILVALVYCVTGLGYTFAICFQPGTAQLWSALFPVVLTLVATQQTVPKVVADLCYTKWALEAFIIVNAKRYSGVWLITRCDNLLTNGYDIKDWYLCLVLMFAYGVLFRCIAFTCMITLKRN